MEDFERIRELGKGSFGAAILVRRKCDNKQLVVKEVVLSNLSKKEIEEARKEANFLTPFFIGRAHFCTTNLGIWSFFGQETYSHFVAQKTRIIRKLFIFSSKKVEIGDQSWIIKNI